MIIVLEASKKLTSLQNLNWPVFRLGENQPEQKNKLIFYYNEYINSENNIKSTYKIVDDKSINKPTLGLRRLHIEKDELYKISAAIYMLQDLIKLAKPTTWFIDNTGQLFQYKKSTRAKLQTYRIKQVLPAAGIGCILEVEGLVERFKSLTVPQKELYANILSYNGKHLLYGLSKEIITPTWRLV